MSKRTKRNNQKILSQLKIQRGLEREKYLEQGGEVCRWRGIHTVRKDRKKAKSKRACRGNHNANNY